MGRGALTPGAASPFPALSFPRPRTWSSWTQEKEPHKLRPTPDQTAQGSAVPGQKNAPAVAKNIMFGFFLTMLKPSQKTLCFNRTPSFPLPLQSNSNMVSHTLPSIPQLQCYLYKYFPTA